jgi:hypothetical protein
MLELDNIDIGVTILDQDLSTEAVISETHFELAVQFRNTCMSERLRHVDLLK